MNKGSLLIIISLIFSFSFNYQEEKISSYVDVMLSQILYEFIDMKDLSFEEEKIKEKFENNIITYFDGLKNYQLDKFIFLAREREINVDITYTHYLFTYNIKKVGKIDEKKSWNITNSPLFDY